MSNAFQEAAGFIREHLAKGLSEDQLRQHFSSHGWSNEHINQVFALVDPSQPAKYTVRQSLKDVYSAIRYNWQAFFACLTISVVASYLSLLLVLALVDLLPGLGSASGVVLMIAELAALACYLGWYALATAFVMATTAKALADGLHRRRSDIKRIFQVSRSLVPRAAVANAVGAAITFLPVFFGLILSFSLLLFGVARGDDLLIFSILFPILILSSVIWAIIVSLRLALVQQVAVFEPGLGVRQTLKRSSSLLRNGKFRNKGQWFLVKGFFLLLAVFIILALISGDKNIDAFLASDSLFATASFYLISGVVVCCLTALYLNRAHQSPNR